MRPIRKSLPILVQHDFNALTYGALPLCVILANGLDGWYESRYANLYYREASNYYHERVNHLDFCDSFSYPQVLDVQFLSLAEASKITSATDLIRGTIAAGSYIVLFADRCQLRGEKGFYSHEFLYYGYDDSSDLLSAVGFSKQRKFETQQFSYSNVDRAFERLLESPVVGNGGPGPISVPIQILTCKRSRAPWEPAILVSELRSFLESSAVIFNDTCRWWWINKMETYPVQFQSFGLAAFADLQRVCGTLGADELLDFPAVHFIYEHAKMLKSRLILLDRRLIDEQTTADIAKRTETGVLDDVILAANHLRLRYFAMITGRTPFPGWRDSCQELLSRVQSQEAIAVSSMLHILESPRTHSDATKRQRTSGK